MSDMTRAEAIKILSECKEKGFKHTFYTLDEYHTAIDMAINSLRIDEQYDLAMEQADTVSLKAYEQVMWERDIAIQQLKELGYGFGEKIEPTGWIPVSERLPKLREDEDDTFISDNVLVWLSHEFDAENPMICYYFKYDEWEGFVPTALSKDWQDIHSGLVYPVAWMPLPEPYKAESEGEE